MKLRLLISMICLGAGLMYAQGPGGRRGPDREATQLGLTADQQNIAHTARAEANVQSKALRDQVKVLRLELTAAIKAGDTGKIDSLAPNIAQLEGQITAIDAKMQAKIYASLTPDQKAKVDARPGMMGRMTMGGRPGPPTQ
jgi:Spy/CpxP family protein refolding chaperone